MTVDLEKASKIAEAYTAAWNSGSPDAVASFYAPDGQIVINRGQPWVGRTGIAAMAAGFFADVPDLQLVCDDVRCAGDHVAYCWTFTGTHAATERPLRVVGWEEWISMPTSRSWHRGVGSTPPTTNARPRRDR